jgi:hypothetical protein
MDVLEQVAEGAGWGRERIVAVAIVIGFCPIACCAWGALRLVRCLCCDIDVFRCGGCGFALCAVVQAATCGLVVGFVAHFVPCLWLTCDLKEGDDGGLRLAIWIGTGVTVFVLLLVTYYTGCGVQPLCVKRVRQSKGTKYGDVNGRDLTGV